MLQLMKIETIPNIPSLFLSLRNFAVVSLITKKMQLVYDLKLKKSEILREKPTGIKV